MYKGEYEGSYNPGIGWGEVGVSGVDKEMEEYHLLEEMVMLEEVMQGSEIRAVDVPIFTSFSKGRGRRRANPVEVVLVMIRERIVRGHSGSKILRKYKLHRDGDDRLSALVKEALGEKADSLSEQECLEWVYQQQYLKARFRLLNLRQA